ncbi:MAG: NUDIX hydrolase [Anaerolineales bacterium]
MNQISSTDLPESVIVQRLAEVEDNPQTWDYPAEIFSEPPRPAAVLIPLLLRNDCYHLLFTRRTGDLPEHSGQVAFPGGQADNDDSSPEETALREAYEEIGLKAKDVRILGRLNRIQTISNYLVTPVVSIIPWPYPFRIATQEVSRVFTIPMAWLADPTNHEIRQRTLPSPYAPVPVIYFNHYQDELLWGISAQITLDLLKALKLF